MIVFVERDIAIDMGTDSTLLYVDGNGIRLREPTVVAMDKQDGRMLRVGEEARKMLGRTPGELVRLRQLGLTMVYMGLESGCDAVLERMRKGHTAADIVAAGQKVNAAGILLSVTAISGLGGVELWREHAMDTAAALSAMKPAYIGLLTLMVEPGTPLYDWVEQGKFTLPDSRLVLEETALLIAGLDAPGAVFRMNHASNYLTLKGTLNQDKQALLQRIHSAMSGRTDLRPEYFRAL